MADAVLGWAGLAKSAESRYHVSAPVLLGLISIESHGDETAVSPAGAFGGTQFMPGTARAYGVRRGDRRSQVFGAARYLNDLGFQRDPRGALAKYNGGPANPQYGYADDVLKAAKRYGHVKVPAGSSPAARSSSSSSSSGGGIFSGLGDLAVKALLWITLVTVGGVLVMQGLQRSLGVKAPGIKGILGEPQGATG